MMDCETVGEERCFEDRRSEGRISEKGSRKDCERNGERKIDWVQEMRNQHFRVVFLTN